MVEVPGSSPVVPTRFGSRDSCLHGIHGVAALIKLLNKRFALYIAFESSIVTSVFVVHHAAHHNLTHRALV